MANYEDLRAQRDSGGTSALSSTVQSLRGVRGDRTRGSIVNYYEDLGLSTSEDAYNQWKAYDTDYQKNLKESQSLIASRQKELDAAKASYQQSVNSLTGIKDTVNKSWSTHQSKDMIPVYIGTEQAIDAKNSKFVTAGKYYLPKNAASQLFSETQKSNKWDVYYADNGSLMMKAVTERDANSPITNSSKQVQEWNEVVKNISKQYKEDYITKATDKFSKEYQSTNAALKEQASALDTAYGQLNEAKGKISYLKQDRANQLQALRDTYTSKINTLKDLFGGN